VGFDAATVVAPLDWDFTKYDAGKGTVPEPSDKDIETLFKDLSKVSREVMQVAGLNQVAEDATPDEIMQAMADMDGELGISKLVAGFTKAFAKLCKNQPTALQLNKLPMRVRMHFYMWLAGELRPEAGGAGSMPQLLPTNGLSRIGTRA
jgi:hypothetical protein